MEFRFLVTTPDFVSTNTNGAFMENIFHGEYQTKIFGYAVLKISAGDVYTPLKNWYSQPSPTATNTTFYGGPGQYTTTPSNMYDMDVQASCSRLREASDHLWRRISL